MNRKYYILVAFSVITILTTSFLLSGKCKKYILSGQVILHKPYCGGAYPSPEMANGYDYPYKNQKFGIVTDSVTRNIIATFTTDENGNFQVKLDKGHYFIFHLSKLVSFDRFYKEKSKPLKDAQPTDINCFRHWYNTPEAEITITADTSIIITMYEKCFVGLNPCMLYTGPLPP